MRGGVGVGGGNTSLSASPDKVSNAKVWNITKKGRAFWASKHRHRLHHHDRHHHYHHHHHPWSFLPPPFSSPSLLCPTLLLLLFFFSLSSFISVTFFGIHLFPSFSTHYWEDIGRTVSLYHGTLIWYAAFSGGFLHCYKLNIVLSFGCLF